MRVVDEAPFIPKELVEFLEKQFTLEGLIERTSSKSEARQLGYIEGARFIIGYLKFLEGEQLNREVD